ncbi:Nuclear transport receptor RanBP16 [Pelomyxa schiedti]|nr:Nuclear transport receptor RanBP16 [Pelomyxa schiedti]
MEKTAKFLSDSNTVPQRGVGLIMLQGVVREVSLNSQGVLSPFIHKQVATSFREKSLLTIFELALKALRQVVGAESQGENSPVVLRDVALKLALQCLSFDFTGVGQSPESLLTLFTMSGPIALTLEPASDELEDDVATVQIPETWRPHFEDPNFVQLFFQIYSTSTPPTSVTAMECILQIVSVRRNIFSCETTLTSFLESVLGSLIHIITTRLGLSNQENHHTLCRVLAQFKSPQSLILLSYASNSQQFINALLAFTLDSIKSWVTYPNSVHYLMLLWAHMATHLFGKGHKSATAVQQGSIQVLQMFIKSRLESVVVLATTPGLYDDPLASHESITEHLAFIPYLGRCNYEATRDFISTIFAPLSSALQQTGPTTPEIHIAELQLAWLLYIMGALVRGRTFVRGRIVNTLGKESVPIDAQMTAFALRIMQMEDVRAAQAALHTLQLQDARAAQISRAADKAVNAKLELAFLYFVDQFSRSYFEDALGLQNLIPKLHEFIGITDTNNLVSVFVSKLLANLKQWADVPEIVGPSVSLLLSLASSAGTLKLLLELPLTRQLLANHSSQIFPFMESPECSKHRVKFHSMLGSLLFSEEFSDMFEQFMIPFELTITYLLSQPREALAVDPLRALAIGTIRDLMGLILVVPDSTLFNRLWDWLYPVYISFLPRLCEVSYGDSTVMVPVMKFIAELLLNRSDRLQFESSSPNGLLMFREVAVILRAWIERLLSAPLPVTNPNAHNDVFKPSTHCLEAIARALGGGYVALGAFTVYNDDTLLKTLAAALQLVLALPQQEVQQLPKLNKAVYVFLQVLCGTNPLLVCSLESPRFAQLIDLIQRGLKCTDTNIQELASLALDALLSSYYKASKQHAALAAAARQKSVTAATNTPPGAAPQLAVMPPAPAIVAHFRRHTEAVPAMLPGLLSNLFVLALDCKGDSFWALSRPLLVAMLMAPHMMEQLRQQAIAHAPADDKENVAAAFTMMMEGLKDNLGGKNRENFSRFLTALRP